MRTSGDHSETRETIPITRHSGARKRVVISMPPKRVPDLAAGDRLKLTAELQVTVDCHRQAQSCAGRPYHYNPKVGSRLVIADGAHATGDGHVLSVSSRHTQVCRGKPLRQRQHHCVLVFTGSFQHIDPARLPCAPGSCFLNYVLDAHSRHARRGDRLVIGANRPGGRIVQDRARLNAIRLRPESLHPTSVETSHRRRHRRVRLNEAHTVVVSRKLERLRRGEQLDVLARWRANIRGLPFGVRATSHVILARRPNSTRTSPRVRRMATYHGQIGEANGSNCVQILNPCPYSKVGILRMRRNAVNRRGNPIPLYVNLYVVSNPKRTPEGRDASYRIATHPKLRVARYAPSLLG